jgi:hypothetical protein
MATRKPKESATVLELRNISEQLALIATQLHLLLIYKVDPGAAEVAGEGAESRGRLSADHAFVTRQRERFSGTRLAATKRLT